MNRDPVKTLRDHPGLYRAQLACRIGCDTLDGKLEAPRGTTPTEYALFNLLRAVDDIAGELMTIKDNLTASGTVPERTTETQ